MTHGKSGSDVGDEHVPDDVFGDDYLYFYEERLAPKRSEREAALIAELAALEPGARVLDVPCGHGRIAGPLAARGLRVTGIDSSKPFIERARADFPQVRFEMGDMRGLAFDADFDCVVNWFSSFGYFEPAENDRVLAGFARALRPGGRLVLDQRNPEAMTRMLGAMPDSTAAIVIERGGDLLVDRVRQAGDRLAVERWSVRAGRVRKTRFSLELVAPGTLEERLRTAGFGEVHLFGSDGAPFDPGGERMIAVATR